jgi:hypothetical protein
MLICVFIGVAIFSYLSLRNFTSMYICWMATMSFVITVVPDLQSITNLDMTLERSIGLIMGLVVMALVMNFFCPLNPVKQFANLRMRIHKKLAIAWQLLGQASPSSVSKQKTALRALQNELMPLLNEGMMMAKQTNNMKTWQPIADSILDQQWCMNYLTKDSLRYLRENAPSQWRQACQQTKRVLITPSSKDKKAILEIWQDWANALEHAPKSERKAAGESWLLLQAAVTFSQKLPSA